MKNEYKQKYKFNILSFIILFDIIFFSHFPHTILNLLITFYNSCASSNLRYNVGNFR